MNSRSKGKRGELEAVTFFVPGKPATQGSKVAMRTKSGRSFVKDSCAGLKDWRAKVGAYAMQQVSGVMTEPVIAEFEFRFARPASHYRTGRNAALVRDAAPDQHTQKPDLSKCVRAVEDAMTGIVYADDSQIVESHHRKVWVGRDETPGVKVIVYPTAHAGGREG